MMSCHGVNGTTWRRMDNFDTGFLLWGTIVLKADKEIGLLLPDMSRKGQCADPGRIRAVTSLFLTDVNCTTGNIIRQNTHHSPVRAIQHSS